MDKLIEIHGRFVRDTIELNKYSSNIITIAPSLIFLISNFFLVYSFCHRYTRFGYTSFKIWFFREVTFHWSYFYLSKLWFIVMKACKIFTSYLCQQSETNLDVTKYKNCTLFGLFFISILSSVPLIFCIIKSCTRNRVPNFLMWVGEDPWLRTEIGLAGHYLDRPPHFALPERKRCAYHTKRSSSTEETPQKGTYLRISKSLESFKSMEHIRE